MAIAHVNGTATFSGGSATSLASSALSVATGNLLVVFIRLGNGLTTVSGVTDTAANRFVLHGTFSVSSGQRTELWAAWNITGHATNVVTATFGTSTANAINVVQFSGMAPTPWDGANGANWATGATVISPAFTTVVADAVLVTGSDVAATGGTWTPGTGYTIAQQDASTVTMIQYKVVAAKQTAVTASATSSSTAAKTIIAAAFAAAVAAGSSGERAAAFVGVLG